MRSGSGLRLLVAIGIMVGALGLFGCPKRPEVVQAPPAPAGPPPASVAAPPLPAPSPVVETPVVQVTPPTPVQPVVEAPAPPPKPSVELKDVFFDFDRAQLRADQQQTMLTNVTWLQAHATARIVVEGHCDERGTAEYNLSLGHRRARAVREVLVKAGVSAERIAVVSYGEERPFVLGHDESAWKWNRRVHFALGQ